MKFYTARKEHGGEVGSSKRRVLVDSDAFVSFLYEKDANHAVAIGIFATIERKRLAPVTTSFVVMETATVLSNRQGQSLALAFLDQVSAYPTIHIDEGLQQTTLNYFRQEKQRGTSVVDCANVVVMRQFNIPTIFSFDKFYKNQSGIQMPVAAGLIERD